MPFRALPLSPMPYRAEGVHPLSAGETHPRPHCVGHAHQGRHRSSSGEKGVGSDSAAGGLGGQASPPQPAAPRYRPGERPERPAGAATLREPPPRERRRSAPNPARPAKPHDGALETGSRRRPPARRRAGARALCARGSYAVGKRTIERAAEPPSVARDLRTFLYSNRMRRCCVVMWQ